MPHTEGMDTTPSPPPHHLSNNNNNNNTAISTTTPTTLHHLHHQTLQQQYLSLNRPAHAQQQPTTRPTSHPNQQYNSFNRYEDINTFKTQMDQCCAKETVKIKNIPQGAHAVQIEWKKNNVGGSVGRSFKPVERNYNTIDSSHKIKVRPKLLLDPVEQIYKTSNRSTDGGDGVTSTYKPEIPKKLSLDQPGQYVEMGRSAFDVWNENIPSNPMEDVREAARRRFYKVLLDKEVNDVKLERMLRRYTTDYRPPQQVIPPVKQHDSSDSAERSPIAAKGKNAYPYLTLTEQRPKKKKKSSITSSTSEDNSDTVAANAMKLKMQTNEWRENLIRRGIDTQTVDRRSSKKYASKSAKMKRQGSFNIDPAGEFHLSLDVGNRKDMSASVRSCNPAKSPLMDARKNPLQISAEDMVQIANCGARNKNGSLCHFISTKNDNYLSISQAIINRSSGSEAKLTDNDTLTRKNKNRTLERKKKSTHSLAFESSDETLCQQDTHVLKDRREDKMLAMKRESNNENKMDPSIINERRHNRNHTRQRSHDAERQNAYRNDGGRKLVHTKSEGQRSTQKVPPGYFLLEDENGHRVPLRIADTPKEYQSPSLELLDHNKEGCKCLGHSNHSLGKMVDKSDMSSDTDHGAGAAFRRLGTSSREELSTSTGDVEETFDF